MIRGIHHIGVNCRDLDRMTRFYRDALGFEPVDEGFAWRDEPVMDLIVDLSGSAAKGVMLRAGQCYLELFEYSAPPPDRDSPLRPNDRGYTHLCIDVTDIAADIPHLEACGMTFRDRRFVDVGHVRTLYGYDPEGNVIEVQQCMPGNGFTLEDLGPPRGPATT
ncbi:MULTISPECIES: VOC family protein [Novosphingobium]|uniref:Lactoylglutathione lyase n=1 Tax=Novosphingobium pentaromativorans TaxID=205844 RepID=A0A2W5NRF1_9SPHN|nr:MULTISPECIES: VOC family protein [Novosphingobium]PZQ56122.1 MAG: lactoylglutathione lyase [Novosphingobium pentaromativorans]GFE74376.1 lactoylglutathione lyase [Novosphingobium sp. TCA1]